MIPKTIHQIWLGDQTLRPQRLIDTWRERNPTWEHILWTDEDLVNGNFKLRNQKQFDWCQLYAGKANVLRYEILFKHGGFFVDADAECIAPLDDFFIDNCDAFGFWEQETIRPGLICNGYFGASKKNMIMSLVIAEIAKLQEHDIINQATWIATGPMLLTKIINHYRCKIDIYPSYMMIPEHFAAPELAYKGYGKVYSRQHWGKNSTIYEDLKKEQALKGAKK